MDEIKKFDYIREKERDIFLTSKNEINEVENEFKLKVLFFKKKYETLKENEEKLTKYIEDIK